MNIEKSMENQRVKCKIWTRSMGYYRPTCNFNIGKQSEYKQRQFFTENIAMKAVTC